MKIKWLYVSVLVTVLAIISISVYAFSILTNNQGYARRYLDSDIPFVYKLNDSTPGNYFDSIHLGAQSWENVASSYFEFEYGGNTFVSSDGQDGTNLVFFDIQGVNFAPGTNAIAYSRTWTTGIGSNYHAIESDLIWNARDFPPSPTGASGQQDLQSVITHEFGHHLGLGHAGPVGGPPGVGPLIQAATMYGTSSSGDTTKRSLHIDDIAGVSAIYPTWIVQGTVYDSTSGLAIDSVKISSDDVYGSFVGELIIDPSTGIAQLPGYFVDIVFTDQIGDYSVVALKQNFDLSASYYGYETQSVSVSFDSAGGIGQTQTIIKDFELSPNPLSTISGTVSDSVTSVAVLAKIKIFAISDKPGAPENAVVDTLTGINGDFNFTLPSYEDYNVVIFPQSPYAGKSYEINNLSLSGEIVDFKVTPAEIMLVDDDNGQEYEQFYFEDFQTLNKTFHHWDVQVNGVPSAADRDAYPSRLMFWFTGDSSNMPLTVDEQNEILDHLVSGGKLFLTGQDIAEKNTGSNLTNKIGVEFSQNSTLSLILGVPGEELGNGLVFNTAGYGGSNNQTSRDILNISDSVSTTTIFNYGTGSNNPAGVRSENGSENYKLVFLGFGAEAINDPSRRQTLYARVIDYLTSPITDIDENLVQSHMPNKFELKQNYPNPFNPETTIEFSVPQNTKVFLVVFNSLGQKIRTITDENLPAGHYDFTWNGKDDYGKIVSSGIYFYRMNTEAGFNKTKKLLLLK